MKKLTALFLVTLGWSTIVLASTIQESPLSASVEISKPESPRKPLELQQNNWLEYVIPRLRERESGGNAFARNEQDALITGHASIGCFQYQPPTFFTFVKKYGLMPYAEDHEIFNNINDCEFQEKLTRLILLKEKNGWMHWKNTFLELNLPKSY